MQFLAHASRNKSTWWQLHNSLVFWTIDRCWFQLTVKNMWFNCCSVLKTLFVLLVACVHHRLSFVQTCTKCMKIFDVGVYNYLHTSNKSWKSVDPAAAGSSMRSRIQCAEYNSCNLQYKPVHRSMITRTLAFALPSLFASNLAKTEPSLSLWTQCSAVS